MYIQDSPPASPQLAFSRPSQPVSQSLVLVNPSQPVSPSQPVLVSQYSPSCSGCLTIVKGLLTRLEIEDSSFISCALSPLEEEEEEEEGE